MSDPLVTPDQLALFLGITDINTDRAELLLAQAQAKCERRVSPLPDDAVDIILSVAGRAYTNVTSAHTESLGSASVSFGAPNSTAIIGGLYLSRAEERELRLMAGAGGAFSINLLPEDYSADLQLWDFNGQIQAPTP